jgi:FixJ family two-component response regulator
MTRAKVNVAIVDDDESFARALERLLRASGFEVRTHSSAEAFLAFTPPRPVECLVLDIQLGGMSGLELQQRLRRAGDRASIIFVTAYDEPGVREEAERADCRAYFLKPVAGAPLIEAIKKAVPPETENKGSTI